MEGGGVVGMPGNVNLLVSRRNSYFEIILVFVNRSKMNTTLELDDSLNRSAAETSILSVNRSLRRMRNSVSSLFQRLTPRKSKSK